MAWFDKIKKKVQPITAEGIKKVIRRDNDIADPYTRPENAKLGREITSKTEAESTQDMVKNAQASQSDYSEMKKKEEADKKERADKYQNWLKNR